MVDVFDAVVTDCGRQELASHDRMLDTTAPDSVKMLGNPTISSVYSPFSLRQIIEFVLILPLNFIPIASVPSFLILTGYRAEPLQHWRCFKLRDLTRRNGGKS